MTSKLPGIEFRGPSGEDVPFILNSWLKSSRDVGDNSLMSNDVFFGGFREDCVAKLHSGTTYVACDADDPSHIFGWICGHPGSSTVHYLYVKHAYRKGGLGAELYNRMFSGAPVVRTTSIGRHHRDWVRKYNLQYDPYSWKTP